MLKAKLKILSLLIFISSLCFAQNDPYLEKVNTILDYQEKVKDIHPAIEYLYPVAVYNDSLFYIYESDSAGTGYKPVKTIKSSRYIIKGIRAAFPLEENDYKMTCVVTEDVFNSARDYSVLFHEFVHCYQWAEGEMDIKSGLKIYNDEIGKSNYMWELNYAFPYEEEKISKLYSLFIKEVEKVNLKEAEKIRDSLKSNLSEKEYEYMCWEEWKEGSARWIENLIRKRLGVSNNKAGSGNEFSRVAFYYGGSNYIKLISERHKTNNLNDIFEIIYN